MISNSTHLNSLSKWHQNQVRTQASKDEARAHTESRLQYLDEFQGFETLVDELKSADGTSADLNNKPGDVEVHSPIKRLWAGSRPAIKTLNKQDDSVTLQVQENIGSSFAESPRLRTTTYQPQDDGIIAVTRTTDAPNRNSEDSSVSFLLDTNQGLAFPNQQ